MFERYTEKARRTIFFARYEAAQLGSERIETEHLLLGLLRENPELAVRYLEPAAPTVVVTQEVSEIPSEILEAEQRIQGLVKQMEQAIANQDFMEARNYSDAERQERVKLRLLREKYRFGDAKDFRWGGTVESIRRQIEAHMPARDRVSTAADLPLTYQCKRVLAYGAEEAERMNHRHIDPEHLLLGLMREENCFAAAILKERGLKVELLRNQVAARRQPEASGIGFGGGFGFGSAGSGGRPRPGPPRMPMPQAASAWWMPGMQDAGRVLMLARHEASERNSGAIETTDLLRALVSEKEFQDRFPGPAESVRKQPHPAPEPRRERVSAQELPFSEDCKLAFTLAAQEAARLGQRTGPSHLLLGILGVESCAAAEVLRKCGLTAEGVRAQLTPPPPAADPEQGRSYV